MLKLFKMSITTSVAIEQLEQLERLMKGENMFIGIKKFFTLTQNSYSYSNGFTLTEILVTVAIIGILAGVVTVSTTSAREKARDNKRKADIETIAGGLELYYAENKEYPEQSTEGAVSQIEAKLEGYLNNIPEDPKGGTYIYQSDGTKYYLDAQLEKKEDATIQNTDYKNGVYLKDGKSYYRVASL